MLKAGDDIKRAPLLPSGIEYLFCPNDALNFVLICVIRSVQSSLLLHTNVN